MCGPKFCGSDVFSAAAWFLRTMQPTGVRQGTEAFGMWWREGRTSVCEITTVYQW